MEVDKAGTSSCCCSQMVKPLQDARAAGVVVVRSARVGSGIIARNGEQPDDKYDWVVSDDLRRRKGRSG